MERCVRYASPIMQGASAEPSSRRCQNNDDDAVSIGARYSTESKTTVSSSCNDRLRFQSRSRWTREGRWLLSDVKREEAGFCLPRHYATESGQRGEPSLLLEHTRLFGSRVRSRSGSNRNRCGWVRTESGSASGDLATSYRSPACSFCPRALDVSSWHPPPNSRRVLFPEPSRCEAGSRVLLQAGSRSDPPFRRRIARERHPLVAERRPLHLEFPRSAISRCRSDD